MFTTYTVYLRDLMKNEQTKPLLDKALSTYPLYQGKKDYDLIPSREELNQRVLNKYKHYQIGSETVGRFLDDLECVMCEIMPYYNELFKSVEIMADLENPFDNVDVTETYKETRNSDVSNELSRVMSDNTSAQSKTNTKDSTSTDASVNSTSKNVHSDTPGNSLSVPASNIEQVGYASDVSWNKGNNTDKATTSGSAESTNNTSSTQTNKTDDKGKTTSKDIIEHTFNKKGNQGVNTYAHDMNEFRTSIMDVVDRIINDDRITELFMLVF